jgi:DNA mismatch repair protein MutL
LLFRSAAAEVFPRLDMNRIRLLPEHVANQIAAGEVVERPASVVKELVENALDAGARRVTVEVQAGGRSLVRVTDDGLGMSRDDALLALERHATSKIQRAEDLASIATMGFRGEALPSIASVSRFTLTTRERDGGALEATQVVVNGGRIVEVKAAGAPAGTSVEVRQLFFNLPARRKFLRTEPTELAHIQHYLTLAALAHPAVAFTFISDGRQSWHLPAVTGDDRLAALGGRRRALHGADQKLLPVEFTGELPAIAADTADSSIIHHPSALSVWGFLGAPGVSRATRDQQHVFVNKRPVENRGLNHALLEGYHNALMKGRYPVCCLFLELDPAEVDVNIHPAKREVKFHRERAVRQLVGEAVRDALIGFHRGAEPARSGEDVQQPTPNAQCPTTVGSPPAPLPIPGHSPSPQPIELPHFTSPAPARPASLPSHSEQKPLPMGFAHSTVPAPALDSGLGTRDSAPPTTPSPIPGLPSPTPLLSVPLRLVGVIGRLYVVLESDRGMVLMDQHAAHERILYERMLARVEQGGEAPSQRLLLPETVELAPRDAQFLRENLATLARLGVGLAEFGERTFLLDALPPFVRTGDAKRFVVELVDELKAAGQAVNAWRLGESVVAKTVCRHAVKANDPLRGPELDNLVNDLRRCAMPYTCPHGRPTLIEMSLRELEKKFGRVQ